MTRTYKTGECTACGRKRPIVCRGWCNACRSRWYHFGKPAGGPPPLHRIYDKPGHLEECAFLLSQGVTNVEVLAARLGVHKITAARYLREIRAAQAVESVMAQLYPDEAA